MIGNDIVDLKLAKTQSNWKRTGFLEKQFTTDEQSVILNAEHSFLQVWLFWSMKEAAYKCYTKQYQKRFFAPKKLQCKMISKTSGFVIINGELYHSKSIITSNYIHTIAAQKSLDHATSELFLIDEKVNESAFVNKKLIANFKTGSYIQKNEFGIPFLKHLQQKMFVSISTSHHGNYGGFAFL